MPPTASTAPLGSWPICVRWRGPLPQDGRQVDRENESRGISPHPWRPVTTIADQVPHTIPDLAGRRFDRGALHVVWISDIERHEALLNRAVMKGHRFRLVAASRKKLGAA